MPRQRTSGGRQARPSLVLLHDGRSMAPPTSRALAGALARRDIDLVLVSPEDWPGLRAALPSACWQREDPCDAAAVGAALARAGLDGTGHGTGPDGTARAGTGLAGIGTLTEPVVPAAAGLAASHGLPGPPPQAAARTASDKWAMRSALSEAGVPAPAFVSLERLEPGKVADALRRLGGPGVVKPRSGEASAGVVLVEPDGSLERRLAQAERGRQAAGQARNGLPGWIVERYAPGILVSVDGFVVGGRLQPVGITETELSPPPFFVLERNWLPPRVRAEACERAVGAVREAVGALGLDHCAVHAEVRLTDDGACVLEVAARLPGGQLPAAYDRAYGVDIVDAQVGLWLGEPVDVEARHRIQVHQRGVFSRVPGVVRHAAGGRRAAALGGVWEASTADPGQAVRVPPEPTVPLCYLAVEGLDAATAAAVAARAEAAIDVEVAAAALRGRARRLPWSAVPSHIAEALAQALGSEVVGARNAGLGQSPGLAARARLADGRRVFVKVVGQELNAEATRLLREELHAASVLDVEFAPRLLAHLDDGRWVAAAFELVDGRPPRLPWDRAVLARVLDDLAAQAGARAPTSLPTLHDRLGAQMARWGRLADGGSPDRLDPWCARNIGRLAELESAWADAVAGEALVHSDLRADNLLVGRRRTWLVDWAWAARGCAWFDLLVLLIDARAHGLVDVDGAFRAHPVGRAADPGSVDALLAALAGFLTDRARAPPIPAVPRLRALQAEQAEAATAWLRQRFPGWR